MAKKTISATDAQGKREFRGKLTDHEIDLIHELAASGMTYGEIAARFEKELAR